VKIAGFIIQKLISDGWPFHDWLFIGEWKFSVAFTKAIGAALAPTVIFLKESFPPFNQGRVIPNVPEIVEVSVDEARFVHPTRATGREASAILGKKCERIWAKWYFIHRR
jgi:hypothetical protein